MQTTTTRPSRNIIIIIASVILIITASSMIPIEFFSWLWSRLNVFATVFLGIFVEAVPYLLLGTLASGLVEVFVDRDQLTRFISTKPTRAALSGALMGIIFPVCECGVVPLTRRLFKKVRRSRQQEHDDEHTHSPTGLWIMLIPLEIGILIPARPLDSSAFDSKGLNTNAPIVSDSSSATLFETESEERNILDWLKLFNYNDDVT